jgi:tetratricopeptide (TPR) repeat protein
MRCTVPLLIAVLGGALHVARAQTRQPSPPVAPDDEHIRPVAPYKPSATQRPGVLVLRVWEPPTGRPAPRDLEVLEPPGLQRLPYDLRDTHSARGDIRARRSDAPDDPGTYNPDGSPNLGPGYDRVRTYASSSGSDARYYVYHVDLSDPFVADNWRDLQRAERQAQREGRFERQGYRQWAQRRQHLLSAHDQATQEGVILMQAGAYRAAVISLTRASELDQGDPGCRIHLALARVALGHDIEASKVLRRALELQPKLVPMQLELEQYYPSADEFEAQVDALRDRVRRNTVASADEYFVLGFLEFQRGRYDQAHAAFRHAARDLPKDKRVRTYLELTKPATP